MPVSRRKAMSTRFAERLTSTRLLITAVVSPEALDGAGVSGEEAYTITVDADGVTLRATTAHWRMIRPMAWPRTAIPATLAESDGWPKGWNTACFSLVRIVTTWAQFSPQLNDTLALIGQEKTLQRIDNYLQK